MPKLRIVVEYDGACFLGWQVKKKGRTVQEELGYALSDLTGEHIAVEGSGRTDAGVHALGQVASFTTSASIPPESFPAALNSKLPEGISISRLAALPRRTLISERSWVGKPARTYVPTVLSDPG